ncbi:MAG: helix-turn-helix domain-containing protein [Roseivirga sp.]|nr:helix-turn-helix domain-containing protein [Roseivirga sp.]
MDLLQVRPIDIYLIIALLAVFMMLFCIAILPKTRRPENSLLAVIIGLFASHLLLIVLNHEGLISNPIALRAGYAINLTYGPLFYTYFKKCLSQQSNSWTNIITWLLAGVSLPFFKLGPGFYITLMIVSFFANLVMTFALATKFRKKNKLTDWNKFALAFFTLLALTYAYEMVIAPFTQEMAWKMRFVYFSELVLLSGGFLLFSFRNPSHFLHIKVIKSQKDSGSADPTINTEVSLIISEMENRHLYRDPALTRTTLTDLTGISPNRISELINGHFGINFSEWINTYRINEARELLVADNDGMTVKEIYYQVGFNSKSAFYGAFKKTTGLTPSGYRLSNNLVQVKPIR